MPRNEKQLFFRAKERGAINVTQTLLTEK